MKNNYKTIIIIALLIGLSSCVYVIYSGSTTKTAFVKNSELYSEFELKKELEAKLTTVKNQRKTILDSLLLQLKVKSTQLGSLKNPDPDAINKFEMKKEEYLIKKNEFDEDTKQLAEQYSQQIWKQINHYVSDYGAKEDYSYIYGALGDGALMYAKDNYDITKKLIEYMNVNYKGEKK
ncbi:MAG: OmpH family outer membrane protein [Bacteroidetes bacterium]|nr:OmpH family outer membrane protein [Bacteroidota bacterium]